MTTATAVVQEALQTMAATGKLFPGNEIPGKKQMFTSLGLKRVSYNCAIWELALAGEVHCMDQRVFWKEPPAHTRTKEQIRLILFKMVAEGTLAERSLFPPAQYIQDAFNVHAEAAYWAMGGLVKHRIIPPKHGKKFILEGGQAKARQAVETYSFTLQAIETRVDECLKALGEARTRADAVCILRDWRVKHSAFSEAIFLCARLLCHFGLATPTGVTSVEFCWRSRAHFYKKIDTARKVASTVSPGQPRRRAIAFDCKRITPLPRLKMAGFSLPNTRGDKLTKTYFISII